MGIHFGVDYYPEHWSEERLETDAKLMKEMGIKLVRMAEFSWSKMEPRKGEFHFEWLKMAVDRLGEMGIVSVLGTPTAAPPAWIFEKNPEIFPMGSDGITRGFGSRHHDCQSNETYRRHIRRFVTAMADYFKDNKYVVVWQIDNEFGNAHGDLCMCDSCREHFQKWLENKYKTIENLNKAWGTYFWSQEYTDFKQVFLPKVTPAAINPSEMLDWQRFHSDLIVDFQKNQVDIIREKCPDKFITHNCMGFSGVVDYYDLGMDLDFVSHDQYPSGFYLKMPHEDMESLSGALDVMRGIKEKPYWIMEQQAGITGTEIFGRCPAPGQLSLWTTHSVAHGADMIVYFRWRTCTVGAEEYWHGILPHNGVPGRRYHELKNCINTLTPIMEKTEGAMPESKIAIIYSYDQRYAMNIQPHHPELEYINHILKFYKEFYNKNIPVDFISDKSDFSKYKVIIAPFQYLTTAVLAERYEKYVADGGNLVLTMRAGVKDENNHCQSDLPLPGLFSKLLGIEISDYDCLRDTSVKIRWNDSIVTGNKWSDIIDIKTAESLAEYDSEFYKGSPCVTENKFGKGHAIYVGTEPDDDFMEKLAGYLCEKCGISPLLDTPDGVEVTERTKDGMKYIFIMNHNSLDERVEIPESWNILTGDNSGTLKPFEYRVYEKLADEF